MGTIISKQTKANKDKMMINSCVPKTPNSVNMVKYLCELK